MDTSSYETKLTFVRSRPTTPYAKSIFLNFIDNILSVQLPELCTLASKNV